MTVLRLATASDDPGPDLVVRRAESAVAAAAEHLKLPPHTGGAGRLSAELDAMRIALGQRLESNPEPNAASPTTVGHLLSILRSQCDLLDEELSRRMTSLSEIRRALGCLRGLAPLEMINEAPVVLSREFAFGRTMISTVRGSLWLPRRLHIEGGAMDAESQRFLSYVDGAQLQLACAPLETELVRKRCGVFVPSPAEDKRTFKEIVEVSGCFGYVAAPIIVYGRAIGMLHADRPFSGGAIAPDHLDQLEAFAECLSVAFESAVLEEKAALQRAEVENLSVHLGARRDPAGGAGDLPLRSNPSVDHSARQPDITTLTAREREIMEHVATGATNSQIARCLVISEGTVKSHLKHIAKKLNTPSRAAAVAVFAGLAGAGAGQ